MSNGNSQQGTFQDDFGELVPLIRDEWPQVDPDALKQTEGDYDLVVALIATETEHSKALVRKQLDELHVVKAGGEGGKDAEQDAEQDAELLRLKRVVSRLQTKSQDISKYVKGQMVDDAKEKVGQNPLAALLMAIGLGFIFGFILRGIGRGR